MGATSSKAAATAAGEAVVTAGATSSAVKKAFPTRELKHSARAITVMSYNTLAQELCTPEYHPMASEAYRAWPYRLTNLVRDVLAGQPDIVCMQEVTESMYPDLTRLLQQHGFQGLWPTLPSQELGLPVFYKSSRVRPVLHRLARLGGPNVVPYLEQVLKTPYDTYNRKQRGGLDKLIGMCHYGYQVRFELTGSDQLIDIGNTHLFWDPRHPQIKVMETALLAHHLSLPWTADDAFPFRVSDVADDAPRREELLLPPGNVPLILCGDFNSTPMKTIPDQFDEKLPEGGLVSGVYEYLTTGRLPAAHAHHFGGYYERSPMPQLNNPLGALSSAYKQVLGAEPRYTNYTRNFKDTLDYLFYTPHLLVPVQAADIPPVAELDAEEALPSSVFPSDHIPVTCTFHISRTPGKPSSRL